MPTTEALASSRTPFLGVCAFDLPAQAPSCAAVPFSLESFMSAMPFSGPSRRALACALAIVLFPAIASAADEGEDAKTLDRVIVTATPVQPLTFETDPKLPRQPVPASDGADYLKTIPGFGALRNGGTNGDPVLRGMSGSRLNLLTNDGAILPSFFPGLDNTGGATRGGSGISPVQCRVERGREVWIRMTYRPIG